MGRLALVGVVVALSGAGCQCFVPVEQRRDGGVGLRDAGDVDAGEVDAGEVDAGGVDAGGVDAGGVDAGGVDAGEVDAGGVDAGSGDAGPVDLGSEVCDGLDNDGDGRVDVLPDGGALTRACPLTFGVCANHVSRCVDGGFVECDYGPDFQLVENRCDGLDNDCDGRADRSRARLLLDGDEGLTSPELRYQDVERSEVLALDGGLLVNLPNQMLWLGDDLSVNRKLTLGAGAYGISALVPVNDGWLRFASQLWLPSTGEGSPCVGNSCASFTAHSVFADGGVTRRPDGGVQSFVDFGLDGGSPNFSVLNAASGWTLFAAQSVLHPDPTCHATSFHIEVDGGLLAQCLNVDVRAMIQATPDTRSAYFYEEGPPRLYQCDARASCALVWAGSPTGYYARVARVTPFTIAEYNTIGVSGWLRRPPGVDVRVA